MMDLPQYVLESGGIWAYAKASGFVERCGIRGGSGCVVLFIMECDRTIKQLIQRVKDAETRCKIVANWLRLSSPATYCRYDESCWHSYVLTLLLSNLKKSQEDFYNKNLPTAIFLKEVCKHLQEAKDHIEACSVAGQKVFDMYKDLQLHKRCHEISIAVAEYIVGSLDDREALCAKHNAATMSCDAALARCDMWSVVLSSVYDDIVALVVSGMSPHCFREIA